MIYRFTFPICNYHNDAVYFQHVYFEGSRCPSHDEVLERLTLLAQDECKLAKENPEWGPHCFEYIQCIEAIKNMENDENLPNTYGDLVSSNRFCNHPQWGYQPITVKKIEAEQFEKPFVSFFDKI